MTLATDCAWTLLRSVGIAAAAVGAGSAVRRVIVAAPRRLGRFLWGLHLVPYLTPVLLVGYAYSRFSLSLIHHPAWNQVLYAALVWLKLTPLATLALTFAPAPVSPQAAHCHRLLRRAGRVSWASALGLWVRGSGRAAAVAFVAVALLAFGEFEMASLFGIRTWTVALFDAQVGGLSLGASLRLGLPAFVCEAGLLGCGLALLATSRLRIGHPPRRHAAGRGLRAAVWVALLGTLVAVTLLPAALVLRGTVRGLCLLAETTPLLPNIGASTLVGAAAAACAYGAAGLLMGEGARKPCWRRRLVVAACLCVPGLLGALVLSLLLLAAFQLPGLRAFYDTPLPLVLGLAFLLLPFAVLLRALLAALRPGASLHAARLLEDSSAAAVAREGRRLAWELRYRGHFWVAFLLFFWGYFDLTASSILAPSRMTPVLVPLYNFMHYGQTSALSAMVCVAFAAPFVLLAGGVLALRLGGGVLR